ncbi:MAG: nucleotide exchange factor GrpE [Planctomycetota bacterium]|jgi:molecular chaperone GrpE (heat shock protein)
MSKLFGICGLVFLVLGIGAFGWVLAEARTEDQQRHKEQEKLQTDVNKLDEAFGDKVGSKYFGDIVLEEQKQHDLETYKRREEKRQMVVTAATMLVLTGGAITGWWLLQTLARLIVGGTSRLASSLLKLVRSASKSKQPGQADAKAKAKAKDDIEAEGAAPGETEAEKLAAAKRKAKKVNAAKKARAKARAKGKAKKKAKAKAERKAEAEARAKAKAERKAQAQAEKKAKAEAKARARAEKKAEVEAQKSASAEAKARAKAERIAQAEAAKQAKAEQQVRAKVEAERIRAEAEARAKAEAEEKAGALAREREEQRRVEQEEPVEQQEGQAEKYSQVLEKSGWQDFENGLTAQETTGSAQGESDDENQGKVEGPGVGVVTSSAGPKQMSVLYTDEESAEFEEPLEVNIGELSSQGALPARREGPGKAEESLKSQTENLEKQVEEFKQMAQSVQQATLEQARPVEASLKELTEQISAIRDYAAHQQERVKKLQDGYDWNIIKNFCLRVIRCIDNLENRIEKLSQKAIDTTNLEEIKDELVFALESNGVEQFDPEINSDYRGQEKNTEAVKDKEKCDDPKLTGRIAEVIRPGYHYFVDEDNVKVVRPAQVKLFG